MLSPDAAPGGVRRTNSTPLVLVVVLGAIVLGSLVWVGQQRLEAQEARAEAIEKGQERTSTGRTSTSLAGDLLGNMQTAGIVEPEKLPEPPAPANEPEGEPTAAAPASLPIARGNNPPPPPPRDSLPNTDPAFMRTREAQIKAFEKAVTAGVSVTNSGPARQATRSPTSAEQQAQIQAAKARLVQAQSADPSQAFMAKLNQLRGMAAAAGVPGGGAAGGATSDDLSSQAAIAARNRAARADLGQFDNKNGGDRWSLDSEREAPPTPYTFSAGAGVIPARLTRGINSELPGQVTAMVTRNVYDSATGRYLLIPQGTQIVGQYSSQVIFGQSAVLTGWQRLIFPDGTRMDIGSMPGADASGYSGFRDLVDNHYLRIYGSALLMSGIVAGVAMSQPQSNNNDGNNRTSASDAMSEALGQQLGQVTAQQISKNLNIAPTLQIRPGYEINVVPTKDLVFAKPYKPFDY